MEVLYKIVILDTCFWHEVLDKIVILGKIVILEKVVILNKIVIFAMAENLGRNWLKKQTKNITYMLVSRLLNYIKSKF